MIEGLRIIQEKAYIRFDYTGNFSEEMGKQCIDAMVDACSQVQLSKALLDCRNMTGQIQIFDSIINPVSLQSGKIFLTSIALKIYTEFKDYVF